MTGSKLSLDTAVVFWGRPDMATKTELGFSTPQPLRRAWERRKLYGFGQIFLYPTYAELSPAEIEEALGWVVDRTAGERS
jgi:hypothetical protein